MLLLLVLVFENETCPTKSRPESSLSCSLPEFGDTSLAHADLDEFLERDRNPSG